MPFVTLANGSQVSLEEFCSWSMKRQASNMSTKVAKPSKERVAKTAAAHTGMKRSAETCAKLAARASVTSREYWQKWRAQTGKISNAEVVAQSKARNAQAKAAREAKLLAFSKDPVRTASTGRINIVASAAKFDISDKALTAFVAKTGLR